MTAPAIAASSLEVRVRKTTLLRGIDFAVDPGEWVSVIGPNGAGKSTLLRAIAGVIASTGSLDLEGQAADRLDTRARSRIVSWVPQTPVIPPGISVYAYVLLGRTPHLHPLAAEGSGDHAIVAEVLDELDLTRLADRSVDTLSGGELQRAVSG